MYRDFYATLAQVLPVLLLAMMFDSGYLSRLRNEPRPHRRDDPSGVHFWTKPRVRAYILLIVLLAVSCTGAALLVLAGAINDSLPIRVILASGSLLVLASLLTRIGIDIYQATTDTDTQMEANAKHFPNSGSAT